MAPQLDDKNQSGKRPVSIRKVEANRQKAMRSTGPTTVRGKACSRRNAIKHGLFVRHTTDFEALKENTHDYKNLLNGLFEQYQPVGTAEEEEVERITLCYWRLQRASRFENAVNLVAQRDFEKATQALEQIKYCEEKDKKEEAVILQLQNAEKEIEDTGEISQELKQAIFALEPWVEKLFSAAQECFQERIEEMCLSGEFQAVSLERRSRIVAKCTVRDTITFLKQMRRRKWTEAMEVRIGQHAIPNPEALDRLLRYEAAIDRSLTRALDRLERLQRRRSGERIPPSVSGRLTQ